MLRIDFSKIEEMIKSSIEFSLSEKQYENLTGRKMPKNNYYLIKQSAIAQFADGLGLSIKVHEKTITFERKEKLKWNARW